MKPVFCNFCGWGQSLYSKKPERNSEGKEILLLLVSSEFEGANMNLLILSSLLRDFHTLNCLSGSI